MQQEVIEKEREVGVIGKGQGAVHTAFHEARRAMAVPALGSELTREIEIVISVLGAAEVMLVLRIIFHALGFSYNPFTMGVYGISSLLVAPFAAAGGIPIGGTHGYTDIGACIATFAVLLVGFGAFHFNPYRHSSYKNHI